MVKTYKIQENKANRQMFINIGRNDNFRVGQEVSIVEADNIISDEEGLKQYLQDNKEMFKTMFKELEVNHNAYFGKGSSCNILLNTKYDIGEILEDDGVFLFEDKDVNFELYGDIDGGDNLSNEEYLQVDGIKVGLEAIDRAYIEDFVKILKEFKFEQLDDDYYDFDMLFRNDKVVIKFFEGKYFSPSLLTLNMNGKHTLNFNEVIEND